VIIIVKESQYNNILDNTQNDNKMLKKWASYIADIVLPKIINLDVLSGEDVFTEKNIEVKLGKYDFFKLLPIIDLEFDIELYSPKKIDSDILYSNVKAYLLKEIEKVYDWYIENKEK